MESLKLPSPLVSVEWLAAHIDAPNLVVLDASSGTLSGQTTAAIPRTRIFDYDKTISDQKTSLPHMLPTAAEFNAEVRKLGVNNDSLIVVYDRHGIFSSPRGWWMFRAMGHTQVAVLDGGLPAWQAAGQDLADIDPDAIAAGNFSASYQPELVSDVAQVLAALDAAQSDVIDARSQGRFHGHEPEPRPGLRPGHMPKALNLPYDLLLKDGCFLAPSDLKKIFVENQISTEKALIFSCGSGVTACILALGAELAGYTNLSIYDGSWSEWGLPCDLPVTTE